VLFYESPSKSKRTYFPRAKIKHYRETKEVRVSGHQKKVHILWRVPTPTKSQDENGPNPQGVVGVLCTAEAPAGAPSATAGAIGCAGVVYQRGTIFPTPTACTVFEK
jgi:hypothetical protein